MKYKVVKSNATSQIGMMSFERDVEDLLKKGWSLQGGLVINSNGYLHQAMFKTMNVVKPVKPVKPATEFK